MASFATLLTIGSAVVGGLGAASKGSQEAAGMDANAAALTQKAKEARAVGSVRGERRWRDIQERESAARAAAAHSGGGPAEAIFGEFGRRAVTDSNLEVWEGEQRGRGIDDQAALQRWGARGRRASIPLEVASSVGSALLTGSSRAGAFGVSGSDSDVVYDNYDAASGWRTTARRNNALPYG
jgi:hypothetical protein